MIIGFFGDVYIRNNVRLDLEGIRELSKLDLVIFNLEAPILRDTSKYTPRTDKNAVLSTEYQFFEYFISQIPCKVVVSLSNNHIFDFGEEGVRETIECLKLLDIDFFGVKNSVSHPYYNFNGIYFWSLTSDSPDVASVLEGGEQKLLDYSCVDDILEIRAKKRDNIVILHGDYEHINIPSPFFRKLTKSLAAHCKLIVTHHPHIIQGKECSEGINIFYSLGNWVFDNITKKNGRKIIWNTFQQLSYGVVFDTESGKTNTIGFYYDSGAGCLSLNEGALQKMAISSKILEESSDKSYAIMYNKRLYKKFRNDYRINLKSLIKKILLG